VTEALTNVARHSRASRASVRVRVTGPALHVGIHDDGANATVHWRPGVGLTSIRERAAELGGAAVVSCDHAGGRVDVRLPLPHAAALGADRLTEVAG
jgi:signal transduction histidine kinase